ncbi:NAD-P-binding protein [Irpex rosettiformis]|uniref:NAD-P-binding protein n=1 Tax=Irpex rosettiformis TaxID=378272 RepID=A0ACB8U4T9_9APHY|nr:NAD-P-binding protein [Irpex rosettiformis]
MSLPETIHAIAFNKNGGVEVLEKLTFPFPQQKPTDIVVKVAYGGVNMIDTYFRKGLYPSPSFPQISGFEASGVIVKLPTDPAVLESKWFQLRGYKIGGRVAVNGLGSHAEYLSVPWKNVYPIPDELSLEAGAGILSHGLTALTLSTEAYNVKKGDTILIHTVAGGLGLLFTALAKHRGATVIGTTSTPEKAEIAKSYGADHVILYTKEDTVKRVLEITGGEGVDAVFDGVGKDTFLANFELLKRKGTLVAVGNASGAPDPISPLKLSPKNIKLVRPTVGNYIVTPEEAHPYFVELTNALKTGLFKIRIEKIFPFTVEGVREAQTELATPGNKISGKILIKIADV